MFHFFRILQLFCSIFSFLLSKVCNMDTSISERISKAYEAFASGKTKPIQFRKQQLLQLFKCLNENEEKFCEALHHDLHRPKFEAVLTALIMIKNEICIALDNIDQWTKEEHRSKDLLQMFGKVYIRKEPYGVCLIIGSWNYPLAILLTPVVNAIAAGNCVLIKPSEGSEATADILLKLLPKYLDKDCYPVIVLDGPQSADLLKNHRFDLIFFTGGTSIGRLVMKAAAENLTPVVLELGGKNPCYIDEAYNLKSAARRIVWGRYYNVGQLCLSPDYIMLHPRIRDQFVKEVKSVIKEFYGENPQKSENFGRIINNRQFTRLKKLINSGSGKIVVGGEMDEKDKYIAPTVVVDVDMKSPFMQEEMFGPIMVIMTVSDLNEAIHIIKQQEKPLCLYMFSTDQSSIDKMLYSTSSGGVTVNDVLSHYISHHLPFGGVGNSGMGSYHGKDGFNAFTHQRSCMVDNSPDAALAIRYPPYSDKQLSAIRLVLQKSPNRGGIVSTLYSVMWLSIIGATMAFIYEYLA